MKYRVLIAIIALFAAGHSMATEVLVWDKKPLEVRLEVGKERIIQFPDNILLGLPPKIKSRMRIDSAAGVAYLTPVAEFPKTRIRVQLASSNESVFLDLVAVNADSDTPLQLIKIIDKSEQEETENLEQERFGETGDITIKQLVQYVSHDYFAPARLVDKSLGIQVSDINKPLDLRLLFKGASAGLYDLKPLRNYRTIDYNLTAILLTNKTEHPQTIVYSDVAGDFETVSSQQIKVGPKGSPSQSTLLYLVTKQPLTESGTFVY